MGRSGRDAGWVGVHEGGALIVKPDSCSTHRFHRLLTLAAP